MGKHTAVNRVKVRREPRGIPVNRNRVRGNASTRAKKAAVTTAVRNMRPVDFEYQSPKKMHAAIARTGSPLRPRGEAKRQVASIVSVFHVGLTRGVKRGVKTTFTGKKKRWS